MERVSVQYSEDPPRWDKTVWVTNTRRVSQPPLFIGTPLFKKISHGYRFCGDSPDGPCKPWFFGNYSDAHFNIAAAMIFFKLAPSDVDQFGLSKAGTKISDGREGWNVEDFPGLLERINLAYEVLTNAPFKNHLVAGFKKTERWHTIFKGSIPLTWDEPT